MKKLIASASLIITILAASTGTASAGSLEFGLCEAHPHLCRSIMKSDPEFRATPGSLERITQTKWSDHEVRASRTTMG